MVQQRGGGHELLRGASAAMRALHQAAQAGQQQQQPLHHHHPQHLQHLERSHHSASCSSEALHGKQGPLSFAEQEATCWSCHDRHHRGGLVCQACDKIQPIDPTLTYFDIMGYGAPTFELDPSALEKRYKLLQWQLHPDKSVGKTREEQQYSADQATLVNQAYGVLRQPLARANYMLLLAGVPAEEHLEGTITDPELLMEVMEAREEVEATDDQEQLVRMHTANKQRQASLCAELAAAFAAEDWQLARTLAARLSYWVRLEEAIASKL